MVMDIIRKDIIIMVDSIKVDSIRVDLIMVDSIETLIKATTTDIHTEILVMATDTGYKFILFFWSIPY